MSIQMNSTFSHRARRIPYREPRVRGGAMLGLILGLIIGLAVALGVAIYVAKVPIPFVNNVPIGQNSAEEQKNRNWNPNAALQTRGPAQPASDAASAPGQSPAAIPPPTEVVRSATPQTYPPASNANTDSGDALGEFAAAHVRAANNRDGAANAAVTANANANTNPSAETVPDATDAPFIYFVQTGAYSTPQDADAERARMSLLGMEASITERNQAGRVVYRVRVGPFQNKIAADQISARLTGNGFEAALVRVPR
jgi:cell division protein FtsN